MTEDEARSWFSTRWDVSRETRVAQYLDLLVAESRDQNLIARSTLDMLWTRHVVDSAQLLGYAPDGGGDWIDIGSGAGLPGMIVAILRDAPMTLVEPRRRRAAFLSRVAETLGLGHVRVIASRIETYRPGRPAAVISARAVSALPALLASAHHCADKSTVWLLPKGRQAYSEVEAAAASWQGVFHVEPSLTEPGSGIVIARGVTSR